MNPDGIGRLPSAWTAVRSLPSTVRVRSESRSMAVPARLGLRYSVGHRPESTYESARCRAFMVGFYGEASAWTAQIAVRE